MSEKSLKDRIEERYATDSLQLPVFNRVALELQKLRQSDTVSMNRIADLIMKDQSLASRVLRLANSSFYGGLRQIDTVSAAVVRLGMERVTNLAMVASQLMAHSAQVRVIAPYLPALWNRSFACATGGRWLAEQIGYAARAEEVFLAGLLHDIGELYLLKVLEKLAQDRDQPLALTEPLVNEILEAMHNDLGYRLMLTWELPEVYAGVARDHHAESCDEADVLLMITRLLDIVCHKLGIGQPADPEIELAATLEAQVLGVKEIRLAQLEVLLEDAMEEANALF
ncbi:HDOD domain-containing protein [Thiobaca trueperi]|uniref:HD-like signal output (HDOD) protein n=1 Tax=Thiobaca trueperi TaxID=127458 RepID=A0A4R3N004_9GAMM|nr:HDOD domain-containing protein [Thiobaca trueperi]TCT22330.1 HD-like signal output (HDOD) protein [Thiobaca trueperi]